MVWSIEGHGRKDVMRAHKSYHEQDRKVLEIIFSVLKTTRTECSHAVPDTLLARADEVIE